MTIDSTRLFFLKTQNISKKILTLPFFHHIILSTLPASAQKDERY